MMDLYREARDRGGAYLAALQNEDGSFPGHENGVGAYWGMMIALVATGRSDRANRLCDWVRRNHVAPDGDIGGHRDKGLAYAYPISVGRRGRAPPRPVRCGAGAAWTSS